MSSTGRRRWLRSLFVGLLIVLVVALTASSNTLMGLAVNEMGGEKWPWGLDIIRRYPAPSVLVITLALALLGVLIVVLTGGKPEPAPKTDSESDRSAEAHRRPAHVSGTGMVDAPLGELPPVVRGRDALVAELLGLRPEHRSWLGWLSRRRPRAGDGSNGSTTGVRVVAGLGGSGKTTVALRAAETARRLGWRVWWVSAVDSATLVAGMTALAVEVGATAAEVAQADSERALAGLVWSRLEWLPDRWLLVIDNADDPAVLAPPGSSPVGGAGWLRERGSGVVLVTTRVTDRQVWGSRAAVFDLGLLDPDSAALLVLDRMQRTDERKLVPLARELAHRLGYLPLALHLAGSYLGSGVARIGLADYRQALDEWSVQLLAQGGPGWVADDPRRQILATWELSLDALTAQGKAQARSVLRVLSFLAAGSPVPVSMLDPQAFADAALLSATDEGGRETELTKGLAGLRSVGLVDSVRLGSSDGDAVVVHPLVAEVSRWHAEQDAESAKFCEIAVRLVVGARRDLSPANPQSWSRWQTLAPHAQALLGQAGTVSRDWLAELVEVNNESTHHLFASGVYAAALELAHAVLSIAEQALGPEDPGTLTSRNNLAVAYQAAGRLNDAILLYEATLTTRENTLGHTHPDTLTSRNNLASAYQAAGRLNDAIPLLEATLTTLEDTLGHTHPDTLLCRNNLAFAYQAAGRLNDAIYLLEATLNSREDTLGQTHPDTLTSRDNLASAYQAAGRLNDAIPLHEATLTTLEDTLGHTHPDTLTSRNNLAVAYRAAGRLNDAIPLLEATLTASEKTLGPDHPTTVLIRKNLAAARRQRDEAT